VTQIPLVLQVISDYVTPPQKELSRDLDAKIKPYIRCSWWIHCV